MVDACAPRRVRVLTSDYLDITDPEALRLLRLLQKRGAEVRVDEHHFHWQSQNATTPETKRGREIIEHARRGAAIHLFVRDGKQAGGKAAPFVCQGRATYESHQGSGPVSVVFRL